MIMVLVFCIAKIGVFEKGFIKDGSWMMGAGLEGSIERGKESRKKEQESRIKRKDEGCWEDGSWMMELKFWMIEDASRASA